MIMNLEIDPSAIELHDALIKDLKIDFKENEALLLVEFYKTESDKARTPIEIKFEGVRFLSGMCDFPALKKNAFAGNINYWTPGETTYFYLTDGCISIVANSVNCRILPAPEHISN